MSNLNTLFDFTKFEKRKHADQTTFETENKGLLLSFIKGVNLSFKQLHTVVLRSIEPIDQEKNLCAVTMSGYLQGYFKKNHLDLCRKATKKRFKLWVGGSNVYIKKLDEKTKMPSNIPTNESVKIYHQLTDTEKDKECNIFLGYTVDESWSTVTGIYAVCIEGEKLLWFTDLNDFSEMTQTPIIPITPAPIAPKVRPGIKRRKSQNE